MTEEQIQPQSAVDSQPKFQKPRKQKVRKDPNAPFIREAIEQGGKRDAIDEVLAIMAEHKSLDYAMDRAKQEAQKAVDAIALLPESQYKKALISLAYLSVDRTY